MQCGTAQGAFAFACLAMQRRHGELGSIETLDSEKQGYRIDDKGYNFEKNFPPGRIKN
eukprot:SAG31_NODE_7463_length_1682_cov_2.707517_2_plen_57_part_01